jgi:hypothetical protein
MSSCVASAKSGNPNDTFWCPITSTSLSFYAKISDKIKTSNLSYKTTIHKIFTVSTSLFFAIEAILRIAAGVATLPLTILSCIHSDFLGIPALLIYTGIGNLVFAYGALTAKLK